MWCRLAMRSMRGWWGRFQVGGRNCPVRTALFLHTSSFLFGNPFGKFSLMCIEVALDLADRADGFHVSLTDPVSD